MDFGVGLQLLLVDLWIRGGTGDEMEFLNALHSNQFSLVMPGSGTKGKPARKVVIGGGLGLDRQGLALFLGLCILGGLKLFVF